MILFIFLFLFFLGLNFTLYVSFSISIFLAFAFRTFKSISNIFSFREFTLLLYILNYLLSPALLYGIEDTTVYSMKINQEDYFSLAIPGILFFALGLYIIPTQLFKPNFSDIKKINRLNETILFRSTIVFLLIYLLFRSTSFFSGYIFYLVGSLRYVASFALFSINPKKKWIYPVALIIVDLIFSLIGGMYHDLLIWIIFFGLFYTYIVKPSLAANLIGLFSIIVITMFIQAIKFEYREKVSKENISNKLDVVFEVGANNSNSQELFEESNLLSVLNRTNQAWIFASTVDNMNKRGDFQGMANVNQYIESALLPRFLAPNKLKSADKEIFNKFSGHSINENTSMGLGIFADGYIAYGKTGVYIFGFVLGLIFSITFKLVEKWTKISPFYILLILPLLCYAVRPDCELQTTLNHLVKGLVMCAIIVYFSKKRFTLNSIENQRKLIHLSLIKNN